MSKGVLFSTPSTKKNPSPLFTRVNLPVEKFLSGRDWGRVRVQGNGGDDGGLKRIHKQENENMIYE